MIAAPLLLLGYCAFPALFMNDVDRILYEKSRGGLDGRYDLMPELFQGGEERQTVAERLIGAGYAKSRNTDYIPDRFYKDGGLSILICRVTYVIEATFDEDDKLLTAHTDNSSACL